jgi:Ca2+-binding RTX toxin-like protein
MFCEKLETRRFLTVTLRPPIPPGPSGDPGTLPPDCVKVTQDAYGNVTIKTKDANGGGSSGGSGWHSWTRKHHKKSKHISQWSKDSDGKWCYGKRGSGGSSYGDHHGGSSGGSNGGGSHHGGSSDRNDCFLDVAIIEDNGTLVVTEIHTGATWDVTNVKSIKVEGTENADEVFFTGNSKGADIDTYGGIDSITIADTGTGKSDANSGAGNDSLNLLVGNSTSGTTLHAGSGSDTIFVNSGVGIYNTGAARSVIFADDGNDVITVYDGKNTINGGSGSDIVIQLGGTNTVTSASVQS